MAEQPLVSVIMNCFNGEKYLQEAIDSVIAQTYENWELIFWDNQSTDASAEIIKSYDDSRIRYLYAPDHTLLYEARNLAIKEAQGSLLAFLDVDDWWEPKKLEMQVPVFENEDVGLVCGNYEVFYEKSGWGRPSWKGSKPSGWILNELLVNYHIGLLTIMLRRSAYAELGGFDPRYHVIGDFDLSLRLAEKWQVVTLESQIAHFRFHGENESVRKQQMHIKELQTWVKEARVRLTDTSLPSLRELEMLIIYLNGKSSAKEKDFKTLLLALKELFPSIRCLRLILDVFVPHHISIFLRKIGTDTFRFER